MSQELQTKIHEALSAISSAYNLASKVEADIAEKEDAEASWRREVLSARAAANYAETLAAIATADRDKGLKEAAGWGSPDFSRSAHNRAVDAAEKRVKELEAELTFADCQIEMLAALNGDRAQRTADRLAGTLADIIDLVRDARNKGLPFCGLVVAEDAAKAALDKDPSDD